MAVNPERLAAWRSRLDDLGAAGMVGLLLDLDGTLVDSEPMQRAGFESYFAHRGWDVPADVVAQFMGRRGVDAFASIDGPWRGEDPVELTEGVIAALDPGAHPPRVLDGVREAVCSWLDARRPVAIVTSARRPWVRQTLDLLDLTDRSIAVVSAEDSAAGKPAPDPYLLGAEQLGLQPSACVAAEDSIAGIRSALAAGVALILGVTTSLECETLIAKGADATSDGLRPLVLS